MTEVELKQWGNSIGVILPIDELRELGVTVGDKVEVEIKSKKRVDGFGIFKGGKSFVREKDHRDEDF